MAIAARVVPDGSWTADPDVDDETLIVSAWHVGDAWIRGFSLSAAWRAGSPRPERWDLTARVFPRPSDPVWLARALTALVLVLAGSLGLLTSWALATRMGPQSRAAGFLVFVVAFFALTVAVAVVSNRLRSSPPVPPPDVVEDWARRVRDGAAGHPRVRLVG